MGKKILIYNHGGSKNHGCEALVRTVISILPENSDITLMSDNPNEDKQYGINSLVSRITSSKAPYSKMSGEYIHAYVSLKLKKDYFPMDLIPYHAAINKLDNDYDYALSIGGDVYCYSNYPLYIYIHQLIRKKAKKTILLGCSINQDLFADPDFIADMKSFDLISARESITYELLKNNGFQHIIYSPDTAFTLKTTAVDNIPDGDYIGINVSPLVSERGKSSEIVYLNYKYLIESILRNTSFSAVLIPHVIWEGNDDRTILKKLYDDIGNHERLLMVPDMNCMELKGVISKCSFFVGARTHSTIAAYSTCVPTLVVGYSVKSKGIAKDLFGSDEKYVIPVSELKNDNDLWNGFCYIRDHELEIKNILKTYVPAYAGNCNKLRGVFENE